MRKDFRGMKSNSKMGEDNPMYQYFGETTESNPTEPVSEMIERKLDQSRIEKVGYFVLIGILSVLSISFLLRENFRDAVGTIMLIAITIYLVRKVTVSYSVESNFYLANATLTLRALCQHFRLTAMLIPHAERILLGSVSAMIVERFILSWFLYTPISSLIYATGYYGMWIGLLLCFSRRETLKAYRGLLLFSVYQGILITFNGFILNSMNYFTVVSALVFWTLAIWLKQCQIEDLRGKRNP